MKISKILSLNNTVRYDAIDKEYLWIFPGI